MPSLEALLPYADTALAALIILIGLISALSARAEETKVRRLRADGYCAHPNSRRGYCRNPPGKPGGRCRANHPSALQIPVMGFGSVLLILGLAAGFYFWHPVARYLVR